MRPPLPPAGPPVPPVSSMLAQSPLPPVMLADPDAAVRAHLRQLVEHAGYSVREAADGRTAVGILSSTRSPLLILLALQLPEFDEVCLLVSATPTTGLLHRHGLVLLTDGPHVLPPLEVALRVSRGEAMQLSKPVDDTRVLQVLTALRYRMAPREQW
jgi:CheY-like chemotaxis protein